MGEHRQRVEVRPGQVWCGESALYYLRVREVQANRVLCEKVDPWPMPDGSYRLSLTVDRKPRTLASVLLSRFGRAGGYRLAEEAA